MKTEITETIANALRKLAFSAQTSGGTAGPDKILMFDIDQAAKALKQYEDFKNQPSTAQQATSKSLFQKYYSALQVVLGNAVEDSSFNITPEEAKNLLNNFIIECEQPYPQDSSSGEVEKCKGNCGMNYCDENGCVESKQHLSEPIPPASESPCEKCKGEDGNGLEGFTCTKCGRVFKNNHEVSESLEQAAKSFLMDRINKHCVVSTGGRLIMLSNPLTADIIVEWIVEFATQQQKPLVVLPDQNVIEQAFTVFASHETGRYITSHAMVKEDFVKAVNHLFSMLSAANGVVDLKDFIEWFNYEIFSGEFTWSSKELISKYEDYLTEQSQQQNKGK